ncbi:hypothetical protein E3P78_00029 [Wallemia ichthyophaga]|nr:hypothetical protein E3P78_00029 [Wallemia ichthyophaga]
MISVEETINLIENIRNQPNDSNLLEALRVLVAVDYTTALFSTITQSVLISSHIKYTEKITFFKSLTEFKLSSGFNLIGLLDSVSSFNQPPSLKFSYFAGVLLAVQSDNLKLRIECENALICELEDSLLLEKVAINDDTYLQALISILPHIPSSKLRLMDTKPLTILFAKILFDSLSVDSLDGSIETKCTEMQQRTHYPSISSISQTLTRLFTLRSRQDSSELEQVLSTLLALVSQNERMRLQSESTEMSINTQVMSHFKILLYTSITILYGTITHLATTNGFECVEGVEYDLPLATLRIMSRLAIINSILNPDGELRQWRSINMLCVDMINAQKDVKQSEQVLDMLVAETTLDNYKHLSKVNHLFHIAEFVVLNCTVEFAVAILLPVCDRYLEDSTDMVTFENAHSVTLTLFAGVKPNALDQVLVARVMSYSITLLKVMRILSQEQFRLAYQSVIKKVSAHSTDLTQWCIDGLLDSYKSVEEDQKIKIAYTLPTLLPLINHHLLDSFLVSLERLLSSHWIAENREDLLTLTYKSIKLTGDESNLLKCLNWWGDYTSRIKSLPIKSRL